MPLQDHLLQSSMWNDKNLTPKTITIKEIYQIEHFSLNSMGMKPTRSFAISFEVHGLLLIHVPGSRSSVFLWWPSEWHYHSRAQRMDLIRLCDLVKPIIFFCFLLNFSHSLLINTYCSISPHSLNSSITSREDTS